MKQIPLAIGFEAEPDFEHFVPGTNALLLATLQEMPLPSAPIYLYGPAGCGKSHLLSALAARVRAEGGKVGWFDAGQPLPWVFDEETALVVIDGAERLDPERQHAAFTLFIEAASWGSQMASAGRLPPVDLSVREDLRTRFGWGPVFAVQALSEDDTREVLRHEAERRGMDLSDEVIVHLMTRFSRDLHSLMRLLDRLDRFSLAERRSVTVPLLKRMVAEEGPLA